MSYQRDFEKRLNVGIIGAGSHCYRNVLPTMNYLPVKVQAICDLNAAIAEKTALQFGCSHYQKTSDMYANEKLDAVFICVGSQFHPALVLEAFAANTHVWVEKPIAMRASEVAEMITKRQDRIAVVGLKKAFMPATQKAIEVTRDEQYGKLRSILASYSMTMPENGAEVLENRTFTNWLGNGCHPLSLMMAVAGNVGAVTVHRTESGHGTCLLEFTNGVIGNFHFASGPLPNEFYRFYGDSWHLTIDNGDVVTLERGIPFKYGVTTDFVPGGFDSGALVWRPQNTLATLENKALFIQGMYHEMKYFCDCVLAGTPAIQGSLEFAHELMNVYEAALISGGKRVVIS
ncbi:MAG: Gfo/Idh/MocA family oxidoreductase [Spirochaetes bacterium]|nr:Gfo/Idh/MocA family oxidoreductase [Spirochaetota bacterium]